MAFQPPFGPSPRRAPGEGGDEDRDGELSAPGDLTIRASREEGTLLLALYGELDVATSPLLGRKLEMVASTAPARVVIDLSGLQFLDSTGLHALITVHRKWSAAGRTFALIRGPRAVQRVFELTEVDRLFEFED
jgi:anti-sigma B factor antagonist